MKYGMNTTLSTPLKARLMTKIMILIPIIGILILSACNNNKVVENKNAKNSELPIDFVNFYEIFHTDSVFQKQHIVFPLQGVPPIDSQTMDQVSAFTWSADKWVAHHKVNNSTNLYDITYQILDPTMITEQIQLKGTNYRMLRRFSKSRNNQWFMIYYAAMNEYK